MQSVFNYLVSPKGNRTVGSKEIEGQTLLLNTDLQNHSYTNRVGTILNLPLVGNEELKEGDDVIVHHNVFRRFRDVRGNEKDSKNYLSEDVYTIQADQIYAFKRNGEWKALKGFCFVKPIKEDKMFSVDFEKPLIGIVKLGNDEIEKESLVGFKPNSEYEFVIEGQRLYRVPTNSITIKYEYQGNEEEYNPGWASSS
mgnify:FL=1|jgi:hypothetical protein|tara:strand:- start:94 stop:684 length:591 start_codon:yes stop_codon:yes gene_type:complete